jgi:hypothetical protein
MTYDKKQRTIRMLALKSAIVTTAIHVNQTHWRFRPDEVRANDRFPPLRAVRGNRSPEVIRERQESTQSGRSHQRPNRPTSAESR